MGKQMQKKLSNISSNLSTYFFIAGVLLIITVSWLGVLDIASAEYIDGAVLQAGIAFATARVANAAVTVLRESQVSFGISVGIGVGGTTEGTFAIGAVLDPIHDLIEQYSLLMKYAIGSLLAQKLLLTITSNMLFKILLTITGFLAAFLAVARKQRHFILAVKSFVFVAFLRFALVMVVILNGVVDDIYLNKRIERDMQQLQMVTEEAEELEKAAESFVYHEIEDEIEDENGEKTSWWQSTRDSVGGAMRGAQDRMKEINPAERIRALQENFSNIVDNFLDAMALFALKTLILPLVFLYLIILGTKAIWNVDLREFRYHPNTGPEPSPSTPPNLEKRENSVSV